MSGELDRFLEENAALLDTNQFYELFLATPYASVQAELFQVLKDADIDITAPEGWYLLQTRDRTSSVFYVDGLDKKTKEYEAGWYKPSLKHASLAVCFPSLVDALTWIGTSSARAVLMKHEVSDKYEYVPVKVYGRDAYITTRAVDEFDPEKQRTRRFRDAALYEYEAQVSRIIERMLPGKYSREKLKSELADMLSMKASDFSVYSTLTHIEISFPVEINPPDYNKYKNVIKKHIRGACDIVFQEADVWTDYKTTAIVTPPQSITSTIKAEVEEMFDTLI